MKSPSKENRREIELVVISDVHLGTYGCNAKQLSRYLKSIKPKKLVLNGDIIDIWQFSKNYFPKSHMQVIKEIFRMLSKGTKVYYITGNHDEMLRKFSGLKMGTIKVVDKLILELDGKKAWIFHGDVFDVTMQYSKWLTKLGATGYDLLILINKFVNYLSEKMGKGKISLSKNIKNSVKSAVKFINNFETVCADLAISNGYDYVVCGHIHHPEMKEIENQHGKVMYLNSGDWIENLSALEYNNGEWEIYKYHEDNLDEHPEVIMDEHDNKVIFKKLVADFNIIEKVSQ